MTVADVIWKLVEKLLEEKEHEEKTNEPNKTEDQYIANQKEIAIGSCYLFLMCNDSCRYYVMLISYLQYTT